ncbi:hypothetical protein K3495_g6950 [Podosphaera aphanis]|nr:hypothetical protein K3495_g6950 [Podosphaera aphanis]
MNTTTTISEDITDIEDAQGFELDREIVHLRSQILCLKAQRSLYASSILSTLNHDVTKKSSATTENVTISIRSKTKTQHSHNQVNLYRLCAGITAFRTHDSDPNAVDQGRLLGLRFDVSIRGKFIRPYYVILNTPWEGQQKSSLKIHKHTLPPAIPVSHLANKYLPQDQNPMSMETRTNHNISRHSLLRFARALRHTIVAYHNRLVALQNIQTELKLDEKDMNQDKGREKIIIDISAIDAEAKQIFFEWADGRIGRAVIDEAGRLKKSVIIKDGRRDRATENKFISSEMQTISELFKGAPQLKI